MSNLYLNFITFGAIEKYTKYNRNTDGYTPVSFIHNST